MTVAGPLSTGAATLTLEVVGAAPADADRALARMAPAEMAGLGLRAGDLVAVTGGRSAYLRILPERVEGRRDRQIRLDDRTRANARAGLGDTVVVAPVLLPPARRVRLAPTARTAPRGAFADAYADWPLAVGDVIPGRPGLAQGPGWTVVETEPQGPVRVTSDTLVEVDAGAEPAPYPMIGGLSSQISRLREMVDLPLQRPDLFARLGLSPPRGVLFTGPPGSGKTLLARAVAEASEAQFFQINGPEIVSKHYGDSEQKLRQIFEQAERAAPAIIFIDEVDAIAPKREALSGEKQLERRVVAQLLTLMDGLSDRGRVIVMAATNLPNALDPALRRPGRFDRELTFGAPTQAEREDILAVHLEDAALAADVDLAAIAALTHGAVGADLAALAREAGIEALTRASDAAGGVERIVAETLEIRQSDLDAARALSRPSLLREARLETPETRWSDIGGLDAAKAALAEAVLWPLNHPELMRDLGLAPARGVLLSGPPGGGKTMLARALATESGVNFVPVRAATLLSPYLGGAERAVADLFDKARQAAPAIVFVDEIDVIAPRRGRADAALERVVAQLLIEIDGVLQGQGVFVLAATNRVDAIDPALVRPGRFDLVIPIDAPDTAARAEILGAHLRGRPVVSEFDVTDLASRTAGWSGADLAALVTDAARQAARRALRDTTLSVALTPDDIEAALEERRASDAARAAPSAWDLPPASAREGDRS
ncbi:MAG: AAA family ATPase [Pseudomonadota bacterium]